MSTTTREFPQDDMLDIQNVAEFVAFHLEQAAFHNFAGDMAANEADGLAEIMRWVARRAGVARERTDDLLKQAKSNAG
jgi:hypothetical protein